MPIQDLTHDQIASLVGARHPGTGVEYPPEGLQPYYDWLIRAFHLLSESSFGALRVSAASDTATSVWIAPGRATVSGAVVECAGQTLELAGYNNDTAYLWLYELAGQALIGTGADEDGWPSGPHLKLAEVTLAAGTVEQVLDRRIEQVFSV